MEAHIDVETRSRVDLKKVGAYEYAMHPSTELLCLAYSFGEGEVASWRPNEPLPDALTEHVRDNKVCVAHNANFERLIFRHIITPRYGIPSPDLEQWRCTMTMAYAMSLPGALDQASLAVGLPYEKDMAGRRLMLKMSKPRKTLKDGTVTWWDAEDLMDRLVAYCEQDVRVEQGLYHRLLNLSPKEQQVWFLDQRMNDLGILADRQLCNLALKIVKETKDTTDADIRRVTRNAVSSGGAVSALCEWVNRRGVATDKVDAGTIREMLASWDLPEDVREALILRQNASKTSTAKVQKFLDMSEADGRVRGTLQYHGAGTGRWAARGVQLQNLPRPKLEDVNAAIGAIMDGVPAKAIDIIYGPPLDVVKDCIRGMLIPGEGKAFLAADYSNIEGRAVAWLADETEKLEAFRAFDRGEGADLYLVAAGGIFGIDPGEAKPYRQIGKVAELSLGYQGGPMAFAAMAGNYNLKIGDQYDIVWPAARQEIRDLAIEGWDARGKKSGMEKHAWVTAEIIKIGWRSAHPNIQQLWYDLENAAHLAVREPGKAFRGGKHIVYKKVGSFLWCRLPSGRTLCYPYPRFVKRKTPWGAEQDVLVYKCVDSLTKKWGDKDFYGGLACENVTQAVARDVMVDSMLEMDAAGIPLVLTVHDEIIAEVDKNRKSLLYTQFTEIMRKERSWAKGLPVAVDGWIGDRYKK